jgi:hypothetical protein
LYRRIELGLKESQEEVEEVDGEGVYEVIRRRG